MVNVKSITSFITTAVAKYKAHRVKKVVRKCIASARTQLKHQMPVVFGLYQRTADVIIDKTVEDPTPVLELLNAVDGVIKHYGPALKADYSAAMHEFERLESEPAVVEGTAALVKAFARMMEDVRD